MADHDEDESVPVRVDGLVHHQVSEPVPEEDRPDDLEISVPCCGTFAGSLPENEIHPGETVQVEPAEEEDDVVRVVLHFDEDLGEGVVVHYVVIVG